MTKEEKSKMGVDSEIEVNGWVMLSIVLGIAGFLVAIGYGFCYLAAL